MEKVIFASWKAVRWPAATRKLGAGSCLLPPRFEEEVGGENSALEIPKEACQLAWAETFPKAAPLDVIASWGKASRPWPVGAQAPAMGAVQCRTLWVLRAPCSIAGTSSLSCRAVLDVTVLQTAVV